MALTLNHVSIRSADLAACERFYCDLIGLVVGPRPPFSFPGLWLYAGDTASPANAVVHVIGVDRSDPASLQRFLGGREESSLRGGGAIDHIAFFATGLAATKARLRAHGVDCRERTVPMLGLHQLFFEDPQGVVVELNFPAHESAEASAPPPPPGEGLESPGRAGSAEEVSG